MTRTFRLDAEVDASLQETAKESRVTLSSMVNQIFSRFVLWDRYMERYGALELDKRVFTAFLNEVDEESLVKLARGECLMASQDYLKFRWTEVNLENVLAYLRMLCKYGNYGIMEKRFDGHTHAVAIKHECGLKWSLFLGNFVQALFEVLLNIMVKFEISSQMVVLSFTQPAR